MPVAQGACTFGIGRRCEQLFGTGSTYHSSCHPSSLALGRHTTVAAINSYILCVCTDPVQFEICVGLVKKWIVNKAEALHRKSTCTFILAYKGLKQEGVPVVYMKYSAMMEVQ